MAKNPNLHPILRMFDNAAELQSALIQSKSILNRALESSAPTVPLMSKADRIVAYIRRSNRNEGNDSLPRQRRLLSDMCKRFFDRDMDACFEDESISGRTKHRPGYKALMAEIEKGGVSIVVVEDVDRIGRAPHIIADFKHQCELKGVKIYTWQNNGELDDATVAIKSYMSAQVVEMMRTRAKEGRRKRAENGFCPSTMPYGYVKAGQKNGVWIVDEKKRGIVEYIYEAKIRGMENTAIARTLNAREVLTNTGRGNWDATAIKTLVANPKYTGISIYGANAAYFEPEKGVVVRENRPPEEWIVTEVEAWRIVDRQTWDAAVATLNRATRQILKRPHDLLTSTHAVCANCGANMASCKVVRFEKVWQLRCKKAECRERKGHNVSEIESHMLDAIGIVLSDPSYQGGFEARVAMEEGRITAENEAQRARLLQSIKDFQADTEVLIDEKMEIRKRAKERNASSYLGDDASFDIEQIERKYLIAKAQLRAARDELAMLPANPGKLDSDKRAWLLQTYEKVVAARNSDEPRSQMEEDALRMSLAALGDLVERVKIGVVYPGKVSKFEFDIRLDAIFGEVVKKLGDDRRTITRFVHPPQWGLSQNGVYRDEVVDAFKTGVLAATDEEFAAVEPVISEKVRERLAQNFWSTRQFVDTIFLATRASVNLDFLRTVFGPVRAQQIRTIIACSMRSEDQSWQQMFAILKERFPELHSSMDYRSLLKSMERKRAYDREYAKKNAERRLTVRRAYRERRKAAGGKS